MTTRNQYVVLGSRTGIVMAESHTPAANIHDRKSFIKLSPEVTAFGSSSRWQCRRVLNSSPTDICQIYSYMANNFLGAQTNKNPLKTSGATPSDWGTENKTTSRWVGKAEAQSCCKWTPPLATAAATSPAQWPITRKERTTWSFSLKSEGFIPRSKHFSF